MPRAVDVPFRRTPDLLTTKRIFDVTAAGYRLAYPDIGLTFDMAHLHRSHGELTGELTVLCTIAGAKTLDDGTLNVANFNVSSQRARAERAKFLAERAKAPDLDWIGALEDFSTRVLRAEQAGSPAVPLATLDRPGPDDVFMVADMPLFARHPVIWFGDGGSAKSYLALYAAVQLAKRGQRVLYCDWEFAGEDHRERLGRLCGEDAMPAGIWYSRCVAPLVADVGRLRSLVLAHGITYVICDSVAYACQGAPESAESANDYARATRSLGVGSLHIAHVTKGANDPDDKTAPTARKPFGSIFWANSARATWFLKRADADNESSDQVDVAFYHAKANTTKRLRACGLRLRFSPDRTLVEPFNVTEHTELSQKLPMWQRMKSLLEQGAMTTQEIAEQMGASTEAVRVTLSRSKMFERGSDDRIILRPFVHKSERF